jgi:hypothetical protein
MLLEVVRVAALALVAVLVVRAVRSHESTLSFLKKFWLEPTAAVNLALLRIVIFGLLLWQAIARNPFRYASLPASERDLPLGWGWLGSLPFDEELALGAQRLLIAAAAAALFGVATRVTVPIAAVTSVYVFGLPNFFAKINHGDHTRVLIALVLAASPCGDALSIDRLFKWLRGHTPPPPSSAYTIAVRSAWMLIGMNYFFPGFWKLWESGDLWISGRALKFHLLNKWASLPDFVPALRVDEHPSLLALLGSATLVFELGFLPAMFHRVSRTVAAFSATAFHLGIEAIMGISFSAFFPLIVLIEVPERWQAVSRHVPLAVKDAVAGFRARVVDWGERRARPVRPEATRPWPMRTVWLPAAAAALCIFGQVGTGFAKIHTWPVSVYPTFSARTGRPPKTASSLEITLESPGEKPLDLAKKLKRFGKARLKSVFDNLQGKDWSDRNRSRDFDESIPDLFEHAKITLEPGDRIVVRETRWDVLPPGEQKNFRKKLLHRFVVTDDGKLAAER